MNAKKPMTIDSVIERFNTPVFPGHESDRFNHFLCELIIAPDKTADPPRAFSSDGIMTFDYFFEVGRDFFDWRMDLSQWLQVDTTHDASYYGNWINPFLNTYISYAEGDIRLKVAEDEKAFFRVLKESEDWFSDPSRNSWKGIDYGIRPNPLVVGFLQNYAIYKEEVNRQ